MTLRDKVEKIVIELITGEDTVAIGKNIKEKIGQQLVTELNADFTDKFGRYIQTKGDEYIKPLIKAMKEQEIRRIVKEELEKIENDKAN